MVRQWQELFFDNRLSGVDLEGNPDFIKLAAAYDIPGWRIKRAADIDKVLKKAMDYNDGPCVVEAEVIKGDNVFPMIPAGAGYDGMLVEAPKHKLDKNRQAYLALRGVPTADAAYPLTVSGFAPLRSKTFLHRPCRFYAETTLRRQLVPFGTCWYDSFCCTQSFGVSFKLNSQDGSYDC